MTSGIAGDMALAVLYGLGLDLVEVTEIVHSITNRKVDITPERTYVNGIEAVRLKIDAPHEHAHRKMSDIRTLIENAPISDRAKTDAAGIFSIIAEAEAAVHGRKPEDVHFHEVGALDSILDITGFAYGIDRLGIRKISSGMPVLGSGLVKCAHGLVPVPAPATLKILEGAEVRRISEPNELTTPTGAAILKYYVKNFDNSYSGNIIKSTYSTGTKVFETIPNILRGTLIGKSAVSSSETVTVMETNIDDCSGEVLGSLFTLLKDVCIDMFFTGVTGKKNRPSVLLTLLCRRENIRKAAELLFYHSSTAGVRYRTEDRIIMDRVFVTSEAFGNEIRVKKLSYGDIIKYSPEWDDCVKYSAEKGIPAMDIYTQAKTDAFTRGL
jgi:uncharacterized protein (TIGR00299 family) protein